MTVQVSSPNGMDGTDGMDGTEGMDGTDGTVGGVNAAFRAARAAQPGWAQTRAARRAAILRRFSRLVLRRRDEGLDLIQRETGKARGHALEEILDAALVASYYSRKGPRALRPRRRQGAVPLLTRAVEHRVPFGVVAVITPWNYPLALPASDVLPALLAGNAVVHKPDTLTVQTAQWVRGLLVEAGLPEPLWQIVTGEPDVIGDALIDGADHVAMTGSTAAGRRVAQAAGARLIGCSLELGGKNPMLVLQDADIARAAKAAVQACFASTGQLCLSMERILVHRSRVAAFLEAFLPLVEALKLGSGNSYDIDIGPMIGRRQLETAERHVQDAVAKGATVHIGGKARPDLFFEPTVLTGITKTMLVYAEETFGPVVSVYQFDSEADAVELANDTGLGLNAAIFSRDVPRARKLARQLHAGTVNINDGYGAAYASYDAPMGGMKASGIGRRHGLEGLLAYTEAQTIACQRLLTLDRPRLLVRATRLMMTLGLR